MAKKISPFAALTSEEKQIKWMEVQTVRLPYTQVSAQGWQKEPTKTVKPAQNEASCSQPNSQPNTEPNTHTPNDRPIPPPEVFVTSKRNNEGDQPTKPIQNAYQQLTQYQKTRHRQYDAVIERLKQAERKTGVFQSWPK